jgi:plasmid stabilization system protein ParE
MQLRWTEEVANDLEQIANYLFEHAPEHAAGLVREIHRAHRRTVASFLTAAGRKAGTRELVLTVRPYIVPDDR